MMNFNTRVEENRADEFGKLAVQAIRDAGTKLKN